MVIIILHAAIAVSELDLIYPMEDIGYDRW